ncbi:alpha/beta hydrolase [Luteimonas deserti]|uniref:Alpha/beta hydrolase n=1 Tax=Luteimonas deserti TaxID=2752306 RepID=A0A7Z0U0A2_9GAMM|nr:alpha/beta hydrolase [Luteimonas deserti]NYZ64252.1 alpha/beta hydrolase [Luteimonas deserti]
MRILAVALALAAFAYAALCVAMLLGQRHLLYAPQFTRVAADATDFELARGDVVLRGWRIGPEDGRPLLYFGGNAERVEANRAEFARWFPGHRVHLLAYRGYGASDGAPTAAQLKADALALYDAVAAGRSDVDVIGRSVGSGIASHVAAHRPVARLALITPFADLGDVAAGHYPWLPVRLLLRERLRPAEDLAAFQGEVLVLRAGRDTIVPPEHADRLADALPRPPLRVVFPGAGHNDIQQTPGYADALGGFLD